MKPLGSLNHTAECYFLLLGYFRFSALCFASLSCNDQISFRRIRFLFSSTVQLLHLPFSSVVKGVDIRTDQSGASIEQRIYCLSIVSGVRNLLTGNKKSRAGKNGGLMSSRWRRLLWWWENCCCLLCMFEKRASVGKRNPPWEKRVN